MGEELPPIDYDRSMDRTYIPLPGGWEIQTKGNGSTFRIAHAQQQTRWQVLDDELHEPLEAMALDMRNAIAPYAERIRQLTVVVHELHKMVCDDIQQSLERVNPPEDPDGCGEPERDLVERKMASIGDDREFRNLLWAFERAPHSVERIDALIAYIDGRTAGAAEAWIDVKDELPQPGERVLVSRYAGKVANDAHPGYPDNAWIEVSLIPDRFAGFLCDLTSTGYVTHWKRVAAPTPMNSGKEED